MDGLLIDSEPFWHEAAAEVFIHYGITLTSAQYASTTGMRSKEFVEWWFAKFNVQEDYVTAEKAIVKKVIEKVQTRGKALPGVAHIINYFIDRKFKIGLATSSSMELVNVVVEKLGLKDYLQAICSGENLPLGKPHPQVYLNCAAELNANPLECICFEDSFNGLIAAKAARMKCVAIPSANDSQDARFHAADLKLSSLQNFNDLLLYSL
jgi:sugar-phosphatase